MTKSSGSVTDDKKLVTTSIPEAKINYNHILVSLLMEIYPVIDMVVGSGIWAASNSNKAFGAKRCLSHGTMNLARAHYDDMPIPWSILTPIKQCKKSLGAKVPQSGVEVLSDDDEVFEEEEMKDVVEPDNDPPQKMGDPSVEVTNESRDESQMPKSLAMEALAEGELEKVIEHLTEAILLNLTSAIMYGTRASVYIKMKKPNAAIQDANPAL
ncbi:hypothetical protein GIB67_014249 [Kingdonia uniflora]|uniref:Uncharacterized protein n=1 Tax=Kingdonia uniflora TaxID=39325 RepID=A0A7J7M258_9MAGN|nr:hypothetical protein GIB67_014249 [Kingdonia uniflora]